MEQLEALC